MNSVAPLARGTAQIGVRHMAGGKYLTFEKTRGRYVFQIRVPLDVRTAFDGRTTIRQSLGHVTEAEAIARAAALAGGWQAKFAKARGKLRPVRTVAGTEVRLEFDDDVAQRAVATHRAFRLEDLQGELARLRGVDDAAWSEAMCVAQADLDAAQRRLARGQHDDAMAALEELGSAYELAIRHTEDSLADFTERWNADAATLAEEWLTVLQGRQSLDRLAVPPEAKLPLTRFFGTSAHTLATGWRDHLAGVGKTVRLKTFEKYQRIADDLHTVVGERPVEVLRAGDVAELMAVWRTRDNCTTTITDKLRILAGLTRLVSEAAADVCRQAIPRTHLGRARRRPFSAEQLATLRAIYASSETACSDDLHLVDLMTLTGARLGELLQLHTEQLTHTDDGWVVTLCERGEARLKTSTSERDLPISTRSMADLDGWLTARKAAGEQLFASSAPDRYGHYGAAESKRLNRTLRKHFTDRRLVLQSIRNTVGQTLRRANVDPRIRRRFLGHADIDVHDKHYDPAELLGATDLMAATPILGDLAARIRGASPSVDSQQ
ncbi:tyrosine-type recombinase/integrase [Aromatoleum toluclasticum]|uniref:tyrosine-type recombinase/integrase n=1 Tax=Aromatoleum toluclasticum TaxID=92003 RepID=UPI001D17E1DD|nr:DUF6538 domain-containing protein [Aromatoleum toluclasticum]MCC4118557.1 tyrosine-type recombinase/integrase [Aromatoleum toluclasticum]